MLHELQTLLKSSKTMLMENNLSHELETMHMSPRNYLKLMINHTRACMNK